MKQLKKIAPWSWSLNALLGFMLVAGLAEGTISAGQLGATVQVSVMMIWDLLLGVVKGAAAGLG